MSTPRDIPTRVRRLAVDERAYFEHRLAEAESVIEALRQALGASNRDRDRYFAAKQATAGLHADERARRQACEQGLREIMEIAGNQELDSPNMEDVHLIADALVGEYAEIKAREDAEDGP